MLKMELAPSLATTFDRLEKDLYKWVSEQFSKKTGQVEIRCFIT